MKFLDDKILDAVKANLIWDRSYTNLIHYLKGNVMTCLDGTLNSINFYFGNPKRGLQVKKELDHLLEETKEMVEGKIVSLNNITVLIINGKRVVLFKEESDSVSLSLDVKKLEERYNVDDYIRKGSYEMFNYTITDLLSKEDEDIVEGWLITLSKGDELLRNFILNNSGNKRSLQSIVDEIEDKEDMLYGNRFFDFDEEYQK